MVEKSNLYRLKAIACEQRAKKEIGALWQEWEALAIEWHAMAYETARLSGNGPQVEMN